MKNSEIPMVEIVKLRTLSGPRLWLRFSNASEGEYDLSSLVALGGEMVLPFRDPAYFEGAFVEMGVPTWPNGLDLDPSNLYMELKTTGLGSSVPCVVEADADPVFL